MDDVLENFVDIWVEKLNCTYNLNVDMENITNWEMQYAFPTLSERELYEPLSNDFWRSLRPLQGSQELVRKLCDDGHYVHVVTATHHKEVDVKMRWLMENYPEITRKDITITCKKQMINGDVLVDDAPHNLVGGRYKKILFDKPWNRSFNESSIDATRVYCHPGIYREIYKLAHSDEKCEFYHTSKCIHCDNGYADDAGLYCNANGFSKFTKRVIGD